MVMSAQDRATKAVEKTAVDLAKAQSRSDKAEIKASEAVKAFEAATAELAEAVEVNAHVLSHPALRVAESQEVATPPATSREEAVAATADEADTGTVAFPWGE